MTLDYYYVDISSCVWVTFEFIREFYTRINKFASLRNLNKIVLRKIIAKAKILITKFTPLNDKDTRA